MGVLVYDCGLGFGDCGEGCDLAVEEAGRFAEGVEADGFGNYVVELG